MRQAVISRWIVYAALRRKPLFLHSFFTASLFIVGLYEYETLKVYSANELDRKIVDVT